MLTVMACLALGAAQGEPADWRHIEQGWEIPSQGYADQPYVVVAKDGAWVCTLTTGPGHEGNDRQHVVSTRSTDHGKTWTPLVDIEPEGPPEASWVMPLIVPSGRIYVFYVYNADNLREVKGLRGKVFKRVDTLGAYMCKYSDDNGKTWSSERYEVPIRTFKCDLDNTYGGEVKFFWGVGKPILENGVAYMGLAKVGGFGNGFLEQSEGIFLRSDNIATETDPAKVTWRTLPDGDVGLQAPAGPIAEEHNLVVLSTGALYCTYRTTDGHPCHAYSYDGGHTWTGPDYMTYTPDGRVVKHPRAANFVWKCANGRYLYWFHNHGGRSYADRNPAWVSGGIEKDGRMHWSQPEILLYADDPKMRMSYPCLVEDDGRYFITETQKSIARVHAIDASLLDGMWAQGERKEVTRDGLVLELKGADCAEGKRHQMPKLPSLADRGGFALDLWMNLSESQPGQVLVDCRAEDGRGFALVTGETETAALILGDGERQGTFEMDPGALSSGAWHHVVAIVDGGPKIVSFVVDGVLCDGSDVRPQGWARFDAAMGDVNGSRQLTMGSGMELGPVRLYGRYLRTSEAVANFKAGR